MRIKVLFVVFTHLLSGSPQNNINLIGPAQLQNMHCTTPGNALVLNYVPYPERTISSAALSAEQFTYQQSITTNGSKLITFFTSCSKSCQAMYTKLPLMSHKKQLLYALVGMYLVLNTYLITVAGRLQHHSCWSNWKTEFRSSDFFKQPPESHLPALYNELKTRYPTLKNPSELAEKLCEECQHEIQQLWWYYLVSRGITGYLSLQSCIFQFFVRGGIFLFNPFAHLLPIPSFLASWPAKWAGAAFIYLQSQSILSYCSSIDLRNLFFIDENVVQKYAEKQEWLAYLQSLARILKDPENREKYAL
ncbi:MAG: hypothetical protein WA432_04310 [Candidatus Babeliaceae bacterium]